MSLCVFVYLKLYFLQANIFWFSLKSSVKWRKYWLLLPYFYAFVFLPNNSLNTLETKTVPPTRLLWQIISSPVKSKHVIKQYADKSYVFQLVSIHKCISFQFDMKKKFPTFHLTLILAFSKKIWFNKKWHLHIVINNNLVILKNYLNVSFIIMLIVFY